MVYIYKVQAEKLVFRWYRGNGMVGRHGVGGVGVDLNVVLCSTELIDSGMLVYFDLKYITKTFLIQGKKCVTLVKYIGL